VTSSILSLDRNALEGALFEMGFPSYRAQQIIKWLHQHQIKTFDKMHNLPKLLRQQLEEAFTLEDLGINHEHVSKDGTVKWLLKVDEQNSIETVYIPESNRGTLCISSQVGCALDCSFCSTGKQGFNRNLTTGEIISQLRIAKQRLCAINPTQKHPITNVVMMGMGEPLANEKNLYPALRLMLDDHAYGLAYRRVTVSTSGIVPAMKRMNSELPQIALAVSLHAANDQLRDQLVPINKKYPLEQLMAVCNSYYEGQRKRQITYEYVMLDGINDSKDDARALKKLLKRAPGKINLIPFNPFPNTSYKQSPAKRIDQFRDILNDTYITTVRKTRGDDIAAACGQLAGDITDKARRRIKIYEKTSQ